MPAGLADVCQLCGGAIRRRLGFAVQAVDILTPERGLVQAHARCASALPRCERHRNPYTGGACVLCAPDDAPEWSAANEPVDPSYDEAVQRFLAPDTWGGSPLVLLLVSGVAFALTASSTLPAERIAMLIGVILFHELGHWVGMRAFGYRDVRMFFIPFLGAAVSGRAGAVSAWKRGVVLLLGPLPGLAVAVILAASGQWDRPWGPMTISLLTFINAFNLLPIEPLDGGRLLELAMGTPRPGVEAGISLCSGIALGGIGLFAADTMLVALGVGLMFQARLRWQLASAAATLRQGPAPIPAEPSEMDNEGRRALYAAARPLARPSALATRAQAAARLMRLLHDRVVALPPTRATSVLLIALYAGGWGLAVLPWMLHPRRHASLAQGPLDVDVVPGALQVRISAHDVATRNGPIRCWTFASRGLRALGQKEIILTVKQMGGESDDDYPQHLLHYYADVHAQAKQHHLVDVGDVTVYSQFETGGRKGLLGREDFLGLIYFPSTPYPEIVAPSIGAVIVTPEEAAAAREFGPLRVLAGLGDLAGSFPTMYWSDRERAVFSSPGTMREQSILAHVPTAWVPGTFVTMVSEREPPVPCAPRAATDGGTTVQLTLRDDVRPLLDEAPGDQPFSILGAPHPSASGLFVWRPGAGIPPSLLSDHGCDTSLISADFVVLLPAPAPVSTTSATVVEDGFLVMLAPSDWATVRAALHAGSPARVNTQGDATALEVAWRRNDEVVAASETP